jgi:hypothetical protein
MLVKGVVEGGEGGFGGVDGLGHISVIYHVCLAVPLVEVPVGLTGAESAS